MKPTKSNSEKPARPLRVRAATAFPYGSAEGSASAKVFPVFIKTPSHAPPRLAFASPGADQPPFFRQQVIRKLWSEAHPQKERIGTSRPVPAPLPEPVAQTLERYRGNVDRIVGDMVDLTLEDSRGELSAAKLSVAQMAEFGLLLTEDFDCTVTKQGSEVKVTFTPIPRQRLSPEASARLRAEIDAAYQDFDDDF